MNIPAQILAALPDPVDTCHETHISWVLLAGPYAYKIKKPVTLPFLDYSAVEQRRFFCHEELRLNRRFAPDLYLEVVELAGEPAVKMRRFDESQRLDHVSSLGDLTGAHLTQLARDLVAFQSRAAIAPPQFGTPEIILADALENFVELERLLRVEVPLLTRLREWTTAEWLRRKEAFSRRRDAGFIREGHGDLHLGNLVLLDGRVVPFDGIEFNADFRCIDVASEIAFTLLDLLDYGRAGLAHWLLDAWLTWSGDFGALEVMRFYLVYRALVRAKVAALQERAPEAAGYLALAVRLASPTQPTLLPPHARTSGSLPPTGGTSAWSGPTPTLTITCGPSGCGKTFEASRRLASADFLNTVRIRSDVERKRLFGLAPDADSGGAIYAPEATERTYARLAELAEVILQAGWSVIVDAAFLKRAERDAFRNLAKRLSVPFALIAPQVAPEELARRIAMRRNDPSEATIEVMQQQLQWFEPPGDDEKV